MKYYICMLFLSLLVAACTQEKSDINSFPEKVELSSSEKKVEDVYMRFPFRARKDDSSLYIMDLHATDYYCHEFAYPTMVYKQSFAKRGEAPGELQDAENIRFGKGQDIWILDANRKKISCFGNVDKNVVANIDLSEHLIRTLDFDFYNDSTFIVPDYTGENRFCFVDLQGQIVKRSYSIPVRKNQNTSSMVLAQAWRSFLSYNPQNGILAMATQLGQVIDIYNLKADSLVKVVRFGNGDPQFMEQGGYAIPTGIMGYSDVVVGDDYIYALFWGRSVRDNSEETMRKEGGRYIHVFDLEGNPVKEYVLDRHITGCFVDEKNKKIIGLDVNSDQPVIEYLYQ